MDILTLEELKALLEAGPGCVSLFLPTQRGGVEVFQNPVRLKNLLGKAEMELGQRGIGAEEIQGLLKPAQSMVEDPLFWEHPCDGLAIFLAPGLFRWYHLPLCFAERVAIGPRFLIRPLLPLFSGDERFYVLALSQNAVRLLESTRDGMQEVALEGVPHSLAEALQYNEPQADQNVSYNAGRPFPGDNEPKEDRKEKLARYFHMVDKALPKFIATGPAPLVLAGVEYETAIYRHINTYPRLIAEGIAGNPERLSAATLYERARAILEPVFQEAQRQTKVLYSERIGTGLASEDISEIVSAAHCGRVASLLVADGQVLYGHFDPAANRAEVHPQPAAGDEDFINLAIIETLLHGGRVYADTMEIGKPVTSLGALLRY